MSTNPTTTGLTPLQIAVRWNNREVTTLLRERGADPTTVTNEDRALAAMRSGANSSAAAETSLSSLDEMLMLAIEGGHLEAMRRLLDAGARVDGNPDSEEIPDQRVG